jgi:HK97 family phage prohead protease
MEGMMEVIRKLETGEELLGCNLEIEIKTAIDSEEKALGDFEIEVIGSTAALDSYGEVIDPKGWDLKRYKKNPVILAQHNYMNPPIGRATSVKVTDGKLTFKIEFPEEGINPEADVYRKLTKAGFLNTTSVGFIGKEWVDGDGKKAPYRTFTKSELLELSLVSVPANPEAVVTGRSFVERGIITEEEATLVFGEEKGLDPGEAMGVDTQSQINEMKEKYDELEDAIESLNTRLVFVEGVITGMTKSTGKDEARSLIKELLRGRSVSTDTPTDDVSEVRQLLKKTIRS